MADDVSKAPKVKVPGGEMSVREAGKKGGDTVRERYGSGFYEEIGHKGGQKVKQLIAEAKKNLASGAAAANGGLMPANGVDEKHKK